MNSTFSCCYSSTCSLHIFFCNFAKNMSDHNMHFLSSRRGFGRNSQAEVTLVFHFAAANGCHTDDRHVFGMRFGNGLQDVGTVAGCRNTDENVAFFSQGLYLPTENGIIAIVIGYSCENRCIYRQSHCWKSAPFFLKAADNFRCIGYVCADFRLRCRLQPGFHRYADESPCRKWKGYRANTDCSADTVRSDAPMHLHRQ